MSQFAIFACDTCGSRAGDYGDWFTVTGEGAHLQVSRWNEDAAREGGVRHACCAEHVEKLVFEAVAAELREPMVPLPVRRGGWDPASLEIAAPEEPQDAEDVLLSILDAIDVVLQSPTRDEEEALAFDA
jgi:hypothetical protein